MSVLSIRNLPKEVEKALIRESKSRGRTKTDIVIEALRKKFHLEPLLAKRKTLRSFFGKMSSGEWEQFQKNTAGFSEVDEELWK